MTNEQIKQILLANGFKEKEQPDGSFDLNPYVYTAVRAVLEQAIAQQWVSVKDRMPEAGSTVVVIYQEHGEQYADTAEVMQSYGGKLFFDVCMDGRGQVCDDVTHWLDLPPQE